VVVVGAAVVDVDVVDVEVLVVDVVEVPGQAVSFDNSPLVTNQ
jgi:hypothetical protein